MTPRNLTKVSVGHWRIAAAAGWVWRSMWKRIKVTVMLLVDMITYDRQYPEMGRVEFAVVKHSTGTKTVASMSKKSG